MIRSTILLTLLLSAAACTAARNGGAPPATGPDGLAVIRRPEVSRTWGARAPRPSPLRWDIDPEDVARIEDPWERTAVRLVESLVGEDRRRMLRHFGAPVLSTRRATSPDRTAFLRDDERSEDADAAFVGRVGPSLLGRPLRDALRELPIATDVEDAFDEFRADHHPLDPGRAGTAEPADLGRLSARIRAGDLRDPLELAYLRDGLRIGSSAERLKLRFELALGDDVRARLAWTRRYAGEVDDLRIELAWDIDDDTYLHVVTGDQMRFLDGPTAWSQATSPLDGTPGLLFYVEQIF